MAFAGGHGAAEAKHLSVLLPFSCDTLRIPDELAGEIGDAEALVVGPSGGKVKFWPVEVGRDGDGAFLGRGWPELADACGVGAGWLLVLRHRGRGVLTVKAFDESCCLRELGTPTPPADEATMGRKHATCKPQFISVLPTNFMKKMLIPAKFVQPFIPKDHLNNCMAIILAPLGKVYRVELEIDQLDMFFAGGWSQFVAFHGITEDDSLLLRYEGNMVFTVKVFGPNGCQREYKHKEIRVQQTSTLPEIEKQQEAPSASIRKRKRKKTSLQRNSFYKIGPPSWIRKQINTNTLEKQLALETAFCNAIGLREPCTITLNTSMDSTTSWLVHGIPCKHSSYVLVQGWRSFCQDNSLKEGDICTFNVIETTLWHVVITRCKGKMNQFCYQETPERKKDMSSSDGQKRPKGSVTSLIKASFRTRCAFGFGPPAWIRKEMNTCAIENHLNLPRPFCEGLGLRQRRTITLKTSTSSTRSWQAHLRAYDHCNQLFGSGWKNFCHENGVKVGDFCTFKIVETTMWDVIIAHQ